MRIIQAVYPTYDQLYLQGNGCGLSWYKSFPMNMTSYDHFEAHLDCDDDFEFKVTMEQDETIYSKGPNFVSRKTTTEAFPWFFEENGSFEKMGNVYSP